MCEFDGWRECGCGIVGGSATDMAVDDADGMDGATDMGTLTPILAFTWPLRRTDSDVDEGGHCTIEMALTTVWPLAEDDEHDDDDDDEQEDGYEYGSASASVGTD